MAGKITPEGEIKVRMPFQDKLTCVACLIGYKIRLCKKKSPIEKNIEKSESLPGQLINNRKFAGFAFQKFLSQESISRIDFILKAILNIDFRFWIAIQREFR